MPQPLAAQAPTREIVDSAGRRVRVPARVTRVYAAGPPASVLLYALAPDTLVGWTSAFRAAERPFVPPRYANLPVLGRLTGRGNTANPETVLAQRPDLIFDYGTINDTYVSLADRVQAQTGVPYLLVDGAFSKMPDAFALLGDILDETARGAQFAAFARDTLADIDARVARRPVAQRPRLYFARGPQGLETGLAGSINVEAIEQMGATNVAASLGRGGLAQVSIEQVLLFDPDTIVAVDPNFYAGVFSNPLWASIAAVRRRRVFLAPNVPFGWVDFPPSVNRLLGLRWLGRVLYPDLFPEPLGPIVAAFFEMFYHRRPTEAEIAPFVRASEPA
ncbi:MAG: iron ABC transporter substrate-binding protein [Telmatospirillum sp.]|nr:iron ABC transporter substrate-binding protein [Telmatospirillum sp.]